MKYYSEQETKEIRLAFEEQVLSWQGVTKKKMFGCPCYKADEKLFTFLVTKGVVITRLDEKDRQALSRQYQTAPFQAGQKTVQNWVKISIEGKSDIEKIAPYIKKSYINAVQQAKEA